MKLLAAALAVVMGSAVAHAAQAPETLMMTGPNFQQIPSSKMIVTPNGGSPTTLGAALAATGGCTTNCTFGGTTNTATLNASGAINTTGLIGYQQTSKTILNVFGIGDGTGSDTVGGWGAGVNLPNTDTESTAFGFMALNAATGSTLENTAIGWSALRFTTTGSFNTGVGVNNQGANVTGVSLTSAGTDSMRDVTGAAHSSAYGVASLRDWNCQFCIALGENALRGAADGSSTGQSNTAVGYNAFGSTVATSAAGSNTGVGANIGIAITSANLNNCFGLNACNALTSGAKNVVDGANAGKALTTGGDGVYVGFQSGAAVNGNNNTFLGDSAGLVATSANNSVVIGHAVGSVTLASAGNVVLIGTSSACDGNTSNTISVCAGAAAVWSATGTGTPATSATTIAGTLNAVGGYQIGGGAVLNTLANTGSPILSPELQNSPLTSSLYSGAPLTQGYATTWSSTSGNGVYAEMKTTNLTLSGAPSVHWGSQENTVLATGSGITMTGELNVNKTMLWIDSGLTVTSSSEAIEPAVQNLGTTSGSGVIAGLRSNLANMSSGTISNVLTGYDIGWSNANTTAGSLFQFQGITCEKMGGTGAAPVNGRAFCIFNNDPTQQIATVGHVALRQQTSLPTLSGCGTTPTLGANASDMAGTITEGTTATGCTVTFAIQYAFSAPNCVVSSPNGAALTSFSASQSALTIVNASASGNQYAYVCFATK